MSVLYYCCDAIAVLIIVQAITGKVIYRGGMGYRQENPRAFWCFIGLELLIVVPMLCKQLQWDAVGMAVGVVTLTVVAGFVIFIFWLTLWIFLHPRELFRRIAEKHAKDPEAFWRTLFFGR